MVWKSVNLEKFTELELFSGAINAIEPDGIAGVQKLPFHLVIMNFPVY